MFKKRVIAAAACALAMAGAAHAVQVNPQGTGDFLIAPAYFIGDGMTTDLKVVNTSETQSVVAKVVFRHPVTSAEVLDFLIYLSPSDVWTGTVSCAAADANNNCSHSVVTSADDSIQLLNSTTFASEANPVRIENDNAEAATTGRGALPNQGYIEVVMSSAYNVEHPDTINTDHDPLYAPGVLKKDIYRAHEAAGPLVNANATPNVLTGTVTANVVGLGAATLPMLALADYDNRSKTIVGNASGLDVVGQTTSVSDVEEVLWGNNFAVPYAVGAGKLSLVTFTFPTKLTYNGRKDGQFTFREPANAADPACTDISAKVFDNTEQFLLTNISPRANKCVPEFGWLVFDSQIPTSSGDKNFTEGWARLTFDNSARAQTQAGGRRDLPTFNLAANDFTNGATGPFSLHDTNALRVNDDGSVGRLGAPAIVTYMQQDTVANKFTWAYAPSSVRSDSRNIFSPR